jgi:hypothetical protein
MQSINSTLELKEAIRHLENRQADEGGMLKEQFNLVFRKTTRSSLLTSTIKKMVTSPTIISDILIIILGLTAGYFSKKALAGISENLFKRFFGNILQVGIAGFIAKNPAFVKSLGQNLIHLIFSKKLGRSRK